MLHNRGRPEPHQEKSPLSLPEANTSQLFHCFGESSYVLRLPLMNSSCFGDRDALFSIFTLIYVAYTCPTQHSDEKAGSTSLWDN